MGGKASRNKGKRGEREVVRILKAYGFDAERTAPLQAGKSKRPDVLATAGKRSIVVEVKRIKRIPAIIEHAMAQLLAYRDGDIRFVAIRGDGGKWLAVMELEELLSLITRTLR